MLEWTWEFRAPPREAVEVKFLQEHLWLCGARGVDASGRRWTFEGLSIVLGWDAPGPRQGQLCNRLRCTFTSRMSPAALRRGVDLVNLMGSDLGWEFSDPFAPAPPRPAPPPPDTVVDPPRE
ncbi:MAG: hypothetical protein AB1938_04680 [Myxococcota bacterium]